MTKPKGKPAPPDKPITGEPPPVQEKERIVKSHYNNLKFHNYSY